MGEERAKALDYVHERRDAVWLGLHAALVGALVAGVFDHYLFNMDFHHAVTIFWMVLGLAVASTRLGVEGGESPQITQISQTQQ